MPKAAHSMLESIGKGNSLGENSRAECRAAMASISAMPPVLSGAGNTMLGTALPCAGLGRNCPIAPSASLVRVCIALIPRCWVCKVRIAAAAPAVYQALRSAKASCSGSRNDLDPRRDPAVETSAMVSLELVLARSVCRLAQAIAAQAILAVERHRQPRGFFGAPARAGEAAGEFRSAPGTGEPPRGLDF